MILAYDLGTGGVKASLFDERGTSHGATFQAYPTAYRAGGIHEQRPRDWWEGVCSATHILLAKSGKNAKAIRAVALSGFSMTAVPLDHAGMLLQEWVPIWSDARATKEAQCFFKRVNIREWYHTTGNGDPQELYPIMKLMWLRENAPDLWLRTKMVLGSKDYINYLLTGTPATDYSYASGSGAFDLVNFCYREDYLAAAEIPNSLFSTPVASHEQIGRVSAEAAAQTGLCAGTPVLCGGVDNTMMALGTTGSRCNEPYTSLGSSAWIAVTSQTPVINEVSHPFVFAFAEKGLYTSGVSIFAAGSALNWAASLLCPEISGDDRLALVNALAAQAPLGAGGVLFNPTLSGASPQEPSPRLQGAFGGLSMATTRGELLRSVMEGVAFSLNTYCLKALQNTLPLNQTMVLTGGGGKSKLWMSIFADVYGMNILRSSVGQEAASRGAAMVALRGLGDVNNYEAFDPWLSNGELYRPDAARKEAYEQRERDFAAWTGAIAKPKDFGAGGILK